MKMKKLTYILLAVFAFSVVLTSCGTKTMEGPDDYVEVALKNVEKITVEDMKAKLDAGEDYLLLDVRDLNEHNPGFIPGSLCLSRGTLEFNIGKKEYWDHKKLNMPEKDKEIIVYCKKGHRGILAANTLQEMGYTNVKYIDGGFKAWELKYPTVYDRIEVAHDDHGEVGGC
jgi:rhodanese-related sulfurtransferase